MVFQQWNDRFGIERLGFFHSPLVEHDVGVGRSASRAGRLVVPGPVGFDEFLAFLEIILEGNFPIPGHGPQDARNGQIRSEGHMHLEVGHNDLHLLLYTHLVALLDAGYHIPPEEHQYEHLGVLVDRFLDGASVKG